MGNQPCQDGIDFEHLRNCHWVQYRGLIHEDGTVFSTILIQLSAQEGLIAFSCQKLRIFYNSVSQTFFKWGPLLLVECSTDHPTLVPFERKLFKILSYSVWYTIHINLIFSVFFGLMFKLRGPQGQNPRTTSGPRTTVWETMLYMFRASSVHLQEALH
jgi:hypothetical protein